MGLVIGSKGEGGGLDIELLFSALTTWSGDVVIVGELLCGVDNGDVDWKGF